MFPISQFSVVEYLCELHGIHDFLHKLSYSDHCPFFIYNVTKLIISSAFISYERNINIWDAISVAEVHFNFTKEANFVRASPDIPSLSLFSTALILNEIEP